MRGQQREIRNQRKKGELGEREEEERGKGRKQEKDGGKKTRKGWRGVVR